jgi:TPP-dependent indolepyruvate ferredoxin oxidoreductase alpha subunit
VLSALGADDVQRVDAFDLSASKFAVKRAMSLPGVKAIIFSGECAALSRGKKTGAARSTRINARAVHYA